MAQIVEIDGEGAGESPWEFDNLGGSYFSLQAAAKKWGDYGYQYIGIGATNNSYGEINFADQSELFYRMYVYLDPDLALIDAASGDTMLIDLRYSASTKMRIGLYFNAGIPTKWTLYDAFTGEGFRQSDINFSRGFWHYLELHHLMGDPAGAVQFSADGDLLDSDTPLVDDYINRIRIGYDGSLSRKIAAGKIIYFDQGLGDTDGPIGPYVPPGSGGSRYGRSRRYMRHGPRD